MAKLKVSYPSLVQPTRVTFGTGSIRSLAELDQQSKLLPHISQQFRSYSRVWQAALRSLARENLERFLADNPDWADRTSDAAIASLDTEGRRALTSALLTDLAAYTRRDRATAGQGRG